MARAQTCPRAKAPLLVAGLSNLRPFTGDGAARAGLARAYCHPGAGLSRVRWWRQAVPIPIEAFGLAGEEAAAGIEEAGKGLTHPLTGLEAGVWEGHPRCDHSGVSPQAREAFSHQAARCSSTASLSGSGEPEGIGACSCCCSTNLRSACIRSGPIPPIFSSTALASVG